MEPDSSNEPFPRSARLLTPKQYKQVFAKPFKLFQPGLIFFCRENELSHPRLGLAVSKKNLPRAVDRNRAKRLIRESFRRQMHHKHVDVVVLTRNPIINMDNTQIFEQLDWLWTQVRKKDW